MDIGTTTKQKTDMEDCLPDVITNTKIESKKLIIILLKKNPFNKRAWNLHEEEANPNLKTSRMCTHTGDTHSLHRFAVLPRPPPAPPPPPRFLLLRRY